MTRAALLSVSDKTGLLEFARQLQERGFVLLASSGTARALAEGAVPCTPVEAYTGFPEILDGRVKTLHPKIHAGILAKRSKPEHMAELERHQIHAIDVVAVNLYPFVNSISARPQASADDMVELIDVGGPAMLRAAAKNHAGVFAVVDPRDYQRVVAALDVPDGAGDLRRELAVKVFATLADDNLAVARYFGREEGAQFSTVEGLVLRRMQPLRYGENPHQAAAMYRSWHEIGKSWVQLHGKELSYNNTLDVHALTRLLRNLPEGKVWAAIVKHCNPCGVAMGASLREALTQAKSCDPRSHFGGIVGFSVTVTPEAAANIREDFAEIVVAPHYEPEALAILRQSKQLRILSIAESGPELVEVRSAGHEVLLQTPDLSVDTLRPEVAVKRAELMTSRRLKPDEHTDLELAWSLLGSVRSNAIVLVKGGKTVGIGAGQMSRIDSVELALKRATSFQHEVQGAVVASDAFFPFPDSVETLAAAGVVAIMAPRGAKRDEESVAAAERAGISLLFASERHFRH